MGTVRIQSVHDPFNAPGVARLAVIAIGRADAMGLLPEKETIDRLDFEAFQRVAGRIAKAGIGPSLVADLNSPQGREPGRLLAVLEKLNDALDESPTPEYEWPKLAKTLGIEQLARLLGISASSVRRYKAHSRATPDDVAGRLHFLAMLVSDLAGAYNDIGIRRWFDRKRALLGDRSPSEILVGHWRPDAPGPTRVRQLAHSLVAAPAT
jgi:hypothetical protein